MHASLKSKLKKTQIHTLVIIEGSMLTNQQEFETKNLNFYGNLVGSAANNLRGVNIVAIRQGNRLTPEHITYFIAPMTEEKIVKALKGISDLTAPGIDGYGAKFFKVTWDITKKDIINVVMDFF